MLLTLDGAAADSDGADPTEDEPAARRGRAREAVASEPAPPAPSSDGDARLPGGGARVRARRLHGRVPGGRPGAATASDRAPRALGGVCLNVGCIPSKALLHAARVIAETEEMGAHGVSFGTPKVDLPKLLEWKQSVVDKLTGGLVGLAKQRQVEVIHGVAKFTGPTSLAVGDREITFENCIIAAGSQPATIPGPARGRAGHRLHRRAVALVDSGAAAGDRRRDHRPGDGVRLRRAGRQGDRGRDARPPAHRL